ncbi:MAG: aldolase/citrate lyase family protein [Armatimonadota bacterium]|jgi:2-keto-3-deoxy-L-rhamnonate aldolase RhmA
MDTSALRRKLDNRECVVGTMMTECYSDAVPRMLADAGFDFMIIDQEHGQYDIEAVHRLCCASRRFGLAPIVRVPDTQYHLISRPLDAGALGLMIPRVESGAQAQEAVSCAYFPPMGRRGSAMRPILTDYEPMGVADYLPRANSEIVIIAQIESTTALANLDDIVSVDGIHVALIGPNDMCISHGIPGQFSSQELMDAIDAVVAACERHGRCAALHGATLELLGECANRGMRMLTYSSDSGLLSMGARDAVPGVRQLWN